MRKFWTTEENDKLKLMWPIATKEDLLKEFSDRSYYSIKIKARKLKISRKYQRPKFNFNAPIFINILEKYGLLTVIEKSLPNNFTKKQRSYWLCYCDCGEQKIVSSQFLKRSRLPSCGCIAKTIRKNRKYDNPQQVTINHIISRYKYRAKCRNINWNIDDKVFQQLLFGNCYWCNTPPTNKVNVYSNRNSHRHRISQERKQGAAVLLNGVDRLNNNDGYNIENCVSCCEMCNKAKRDITVDAFKAWIKRLCDHTLESLKNAKK